MYCYKKIYEQYFVLKAAVVDVQFSHLSETKNRI